MGNKTSNTKHVLLTMLHGVAGTSRYGGSGAGGDGAAGIAVVITYF